MPAIVKIKSINIKLSHGIATAKRDDEKDNEEQKGLSIRQHPQLLIKKVCNEGDCDFVADAKRKRGMRHIPSATIPVESPS